MFNYQRIALFVTDSPWTSVLVMVSSEARLALPLMWTVENTRRGNTVHTVRWDWVNGGLQEVWITLSFNRPYAQRATHIHACLLSAILCIKTSTKGIDSPKKVERVSAHCFEVHQHVYHPFVHIFDIQNDRQKSRTKVRCAFCNGSIGSCVEKNKKDQIKSLI